MTTPKTANKTTIAVPELPEHREPEKHTPAPIEPIVPSTHLLKGISTLVDSDGTIKQQWVKTSAGTKKERLLAMWYELLETLPERVARAKPAPEPQHVDEDLLSVLPIGDLHLGLLTWAPEVGESYDVKIATDAISRLVTHLVGSGPPSAHGLLALLGDFLHADDTTAETPRGHNKLDVDGRWHRVLHAAIGTTIALIELMRRRHRQVRVVVAAGNHDPHASVALGIALQYYYEREERVTIDPGPGKFHYVRFGKNLLGITHGDTVKPAQLETIMAADRAADWGDTVHRLWLLGHYHQQARLSGRGCSAEIFSALSPPDAWAHSHGYRGKRDATKLLLHREWGEIQRYSCSVDYLRAMSERA